MAGESARKSAVRQRAKAKRLQRSAAMWERGAEGEEATATVLRQLPTESWTVFHDVRWPGRRYANVDHIVVGPPGVFVIDSKNWSGSVRVEGDVLRQNGRSRETAVSGAAEAGLAVSGLVPLLSPSLVQAVLCFVREDTLAGWARDVMVCSTTNLLDLLTSRPLALTDADRIQLCLYLDDALRPADAAPPVQPPPTPERRVARRPPIKVSSQYSRRSRRRSMRGDVVRLAVAAGFVGILITHPNVVMGLADRVGSLFVDHVVSEEKPKESEKKDGPADREKSKQDRD